ncbi:ATP-binding protein [Paenibacillus timonensis]|uniref:histidine kinase n=1 Tax=Paenibacillus timonensis TaxID=225915 RepID=A0ABW3S937_9BACL|nr:ATP-binding protein [Paenibacillus timonensis]MCH1639611.1 ATP-binding protein [Paenibacillus timonensis]
MRRHSVVFKLFIVTSALVLLAFLVVMAAEGLFFERFYRGTKISSLAGSMGSFAEAYGEHPDDERRVSRLLGEFMNRHDASIAILGREFAQLHYEPYSIDLRTPGGKLIKVVIPSEGTTRESIPQVKIGDRLSVDGMFMDERDMIMNPVDIHLSAEASVEPDSGLVRAEGEVTDLLLPELNSRSYNPFYQDTLIDDAVQAWRAQPPDGSSSETRLLQGEPVRFEWRDSWSGVEYAVLLQPLANEGRTGPHYMVALSSLQPVGEAVNILRRYVIVLAPLIVVLVVLLSLIFSRIVSRPLLALNRAAARLAELDFSAVPEVRSKDEFGELSRHLARLSRNLDQALKELTRANRQLQQDVEEKRKAEELRKELIANISHELKTPLGIVKGFAEGLQDGVADDKKERYLALIVSETDRMNALIMDMLELSKFEVKKVQLSPRSFSLTGLVQRVSESFNPQLEAKGLRIELTQSSGEGELHYGQSEVTAWADPRRIEQVLLNLLSNAVRHAREQSTIHIALHRDDGGTITTTIENAGPSIAEADLARIWDHFYRAERSRDRKSGGTGLGLAIVKHILELHGSEYGALNTKQGVAFYFTLSDKETFNGGETHDET